MKKILLVTIVAVLFTGCATLTPVIGGKSRMQYNRMVANHNPEVPCYVRGFRGGALFVDILLLPLILPILIDATTGSFAYYYFDPSASNPRSRECADPAFQYQKDSQEGKNVVQNTSVGTTVNVNQYSSDNQTKSLDLVQPTSKVESSNQHTSQVEEPVVTEMPVAEPQVQPTKQEPQTLDQNDDFSDFYD
ncbi:MAG: hypothetical protein HUK21_10245 [Fibrobacteraceae bacterium]|nr:hypothetical protein [Fibrobacteraceae bacterium]